MIQYYMFAALLLASCSSRTPEESAAQVPTAPAATAPMPPEQARPQEPPQPAEAQASAPSGPERYLGETVSAGGSPLRVCLTPQPDGRALVEVWWHAYSRVTAEAIVPVDQGCTRQELKGAPHIPKGKCSSIATRLHEPHPIYDYSDDTRFACVFDGGGPSLGAVAWCKLQYTGWFSLERGQGECTQRDADPPIVSPRHLPPQQ